MRWYTGGDEETEITPNVSYGSGAGHSHHATANELSPPLIGFDDALSVSTKIFFTEMLIFFLQFLNIKCYSGMLIMS